METSLRDGMKTAGVVWVGLFAWRLSMLRERGGMRIVLIGAMLMIAPKRTGLLLYIGVIKCPSTHVQVDYVLVCIWVYTIHGIEIFVNIAGCA